VVEEDCGGCLPVYTRHTCAVRRPGDRSSSDDLCVVIIRNKNSVGSLVKVCSVSMTRSLLWWSERKRKSNPSRTPRALAGR
jgi:hypothetical protein